MNQQEKGAVEQLNEERWRMQDKKEAEKWWKENIKYFQMMNNKDGYEYIHKQNLREGVLEKVENMFVLQWQRPLQ